MVLSDSPHVSSIRSVMMAKTNLVWICRGKMRIS